MKNLFKLLFFAITVFNIHLSTAQADAFSVTVTNLSRGQILSPVFAVTHNGSLSLFTNGETVSPELAALAQDANTEKLTDLFAALPATHDIVVAAAGILPGKSESFIIHGNHHKHYISLASMLVTSNDAFMAVNKLKLPRRFSVVTVPAYDAGAEANDESCAYIPGPPCENANAASDIEGEGFIHVHAGIHGIGDLRPAQYDWRNPVAKISIRRVNKHD